MNVFRTYVKRNLKENRLRTVMTIIGIILSMALVTAVIEGGYSGLQYLRDVIRKSNGDFHGYIYNMNEADFEDFEKCDGIESYTTYRTLGWAEIGSSNTAKPYLLIKEAAPEIESFLNLQIISGRMPENENEILVSQHLEYNGDVRLEIGDTITLTIGDRAYNPSSESKNSQSEDQVYIYGDASPHHRGEYLVPKKNDSEKTYTVCGIMPRLSYEIEDFECPGYTAITIGNNATANGNENIGVFFRLSDPSVFNEFVTCFKADHPGVHVDKNRELVALYGGTTDRTYVIFIYGLIIVLIFLILFGTIALIYNSFSISVSERTKQIGILKSTGATKKQIRKTIFYEALFECGIAIPLGLILGCLGIGGTLLILQEGFNSFLGQYAGYSGAEYIKIKLVINIPLLLVAVILVVLTTFISAVIPALRASGISPLDSIRQNKDISMNRHIKGSRLLTKLFGIEGMLASKNYARNRKRYTTTIVSLALSIILFIAASSFSSYLSGATDDEFYSGNMSFIYYLGYDENGNLTMDPEDTKNLLASADEVRNVILTKELYDLNSVCISDGNSGYTQFGDNYYSDIYGEDLSEPNIEMLKEAQVMFMDDKSFNNLVSSESIPYDPQSDTIQGVVFNNGVINVFDADGNRKKYSYDLVDESSLPLDATISFNNVPYEYDDKTLMYENIDKDGNVYLTYMDYDALDTFYGILSDNYEAADEAIAGALNLYLYGPDDPSVRFPEGINEDMIELIKNSVVFLPKSDYTNCFNISIVGTTYNPDYLLSALPVIFIPYSALDKLNLDLEYSVSDDVLYIFSDDSHVSEQDINNLMLENKLDNSYLYNYDDSKENTMFIKKIIDVFSFGFVLLISLVSLANVFNTISTNVALRRREFGMLKSMGLSNRGITKILNVECLIYGLRSILLGLPIAFLVTFAIYKITSRAFSTEFYVPWYSIVIAVAAVMLVVFITMMYAARKIKKDNTIDAIRNENI